MVAWKEKIFLAVIHAQNQAQVTRNAIVATVNGADGVFIINHNDRWQTMMKWVEELHSVIPDLWIGINRLDVHTVQAFDDLPPWINGVWTDDSGILDERDLDHGLAVAEIRQQRGWKGMYFGGVAFKGQRQPNDLTAAAKTAAKCMDVVTTSGEKTGVPADLGKIRTMKMAIPGSALAIASGITAGNVENYLPYASHFLVSSGISKNFWELDKLLVRELANKINGL